MHKKELKYDLKKLKEQREHIKKCISEGNWETCQDALKLRKQRLKKCENDILEIESKLKSCNT